MWLFILLIIAFSSTFPLMLRRLIERYLVTSLLVCSTGFIKGIIFAVFQLFGKTPFFRLQLYNAVILFVNMFNVSFYISAVIQGFARGILVFHSFYYFSNLLSCKFSVVWCVGRSGRRVSNLFVMVIVFQFVVFRSEVFQHMS